MGITKHNLTLTEINNIFYEHNSILYWKNPTKKGHKKVGEIAGFNPGHNYLIVCYKCVHYQVSRILYQIYHNIENLNINCFIDHINHNTMDNSAENLRIAEYWQNSSNRKVSKNNKIGIKGICKIKASNKYGSIYFFWKAELKVRGKTFKKTFEFTNKGLDEAKKWINDQRISKQGFFAKN